MTTKSHDGYTMYLVLNEDGYIMDEDATLDAALRDAESTAEDEISEEDSASVTIAVYKLVKLVTVKNEHTMKREKLLIEFSRFLYAKSRRIAPDQVMIKDDVAAFLSSCKQTGKEG